MYMLICLKAISNLRMFVISNVFCSSVSPLWFSSAWLVSRTLQENMVFIIIATQKTDQRVGQIENLREICSYVSASFFGLPPKKKTQIFSTNPLLGETGDVLSAGRCNVEPWGWRRSISVVGLQPAGQTVVWTAKKVRLSVYHGIFHGLYIIYIYIYLFRYRYRW